MIGSIARALLGTPNDRRVKAYEKRVKAVNARAEEMKALDDAALQAKTVEFRTRVSEGEKLDALLPEAFAVVREAADRVLGLRPFDVQLVGGMALHDGQIAEMKTGEGKTLVATMPVYLNALAGKGVHVVTVNDYLAKRDADWMGQLYRWLGLSVGCIVHGLQPAERREAYAADVTYGTNNEFGFDYLRDNMAFRLEDMVQRDFNYAIVDEVDSILIDEARTPLIISGPTQDTSQLYKAIETVMPKLEAGDYDLDEKQRAVSFTEEGQVRMEELLAEAGMLADGGLYDLQNIHILHHLTQALRAHTLFQRDRDYVVKDGKVVIVDEFTGRMMEGRRYSEGLHQALEAKEDVAIQRENQTLASVTYQNYFRLYPKLAGMTGTALTEAGEFAEIYSLEVIEIPTNVAVSRQDHDDEVYRTRDEKVAAILETIKQAHENRQPVLVGTVSVEKSELLASNLKKAKIPHELLNARNHAREAQIIALAGEPGAVTIATNMAGRGTDIQLGGNLDMRIAREAADIEDEQKRLAKIEEIKADIAAKREIVKAAGGLLVIGTERHESRRIDNQLRGRSGRQGDPGASRFFLSLEDDLMRIFAGDKLEGMLKRLGLEDGEAIQHPWVNKALENAQKKVEARNFEIRKNLLKFDNVMNDQRTVIYDQRRELMETEDVTETVEEFRHEVIANMVIQAIPEHSYAEQWDISGLKTKVREVLALDLPLEDWAAEEGIAEPEIEERVRAESDKKIAAKRATYGEDVWRQVEKSLMLQILDRSWKDHLLALDQLRQGISLRAYAQRDPLREYQTEAFEMFQALLDHLKGEVTRYLSTIELRVENPDPAASLGRAFGGQADPQEMRESRRDPTLPADAQADAGGGQAGQGGQTILRRQAQEVDPDDPNTWGRVPRNAPCPCGSGKKFKHCHGAVG